MSGYNLVSKFKVKKDFNPLSGQPHIWENKFPGQTPWIDDWKTTHNMMLPKHSFHPRHLDIPDDGFSLGDPLDDICYWELNWTAGQRSSNYGDDATDSDVSASDLGVQAIEDRDHTRTAPGHLKYRSTSTSCKINRNGNTTSVVGGLASQAIQVKHEYNSDDDAPYEIDDEMDANNVHPTSRSPFIPPSPPKMVTFELHLANPGQQRRARTYRVQIYPNDTPKDILSAVTIFFTGIHGSVQVTGFEAGDGQSFVPCYGNLVRNDNIHVKYINVEGERAELENLSDAKEVLERKKRARAKRRKLTAGLTNIGRKRAWKKSGGLERNRINGKFA